MAEDLEQRLRKAAEKATPGVWSQIGFKVMAGRETICRFGISNDFHPPRPYECDANATWMFDAQPVNILRLLEALSTERARSEGLVRALEAAVRAANLALFVIRKQNVMPNGSWANGFKRDMAVAEAALARQEEGKGNG